jgi:hypothetical protein
MTRKGGKFQNVGRFLVSQENSSFPESVKRNGREIWRLLRSGGPMINVKHNWLIRIL